MKKTLKSIIAMMLMFTTFLSFAGMPILADNARSMQVNHDYEYISEDLFALYSVRFTSNAGSFVALTFNMNVCHDEEKGFIAEKLDDNQNFQLHYYVLIKEGTTNHHFSDTSQDVYIRNSNAVKEGVDFGRIIPLQSYNDISLVVVTMYVQISSSTYYYVKTWRLTPSEILANS